jgi:hypothetical protein
MEHGSCAEAAGLRSLFYCYMLCLLCCAVLCCADVSCCQTLRLGCSVLKPPVEKFIEFCAVFSVGDTIVSLNGVAIRTNTVVIYYITSP